MRAVVMRRQRLTVETVPDPIPEAGEVLVRTLACGICGTDVRTLTHARELFELNGDPAGFERGLVMGHEFCAEIVDYGPKTERRWARGTRVCAFPVVPHPDKLGLVGYSEDYPGGFGELMRLSEALLLPVPDGLSTELAALAEPLAVALHAVERASLRPDDLAMVVGCGPVGLAVVAALRLRGVRAIVAADPSPRRLALARSLGASHPVDPARTSPYETWFEVALSMGAVPVYPSVAAPRGKPLHPAAIFECVGAPGLLDEVVRGAPRRARIVVMGACMSEDRIHPAIATGKELSLLFSSGYELGELAEAIDLLAQERIDLSPLITARIGLDEVPAAFTALADPEAQIKVLVCPGGPDA